MVASESAGIWERNTFVGFARTVWWISSSSRSTAKKNSRLRDVRRRCTRNAHVKVCCGCAQRHAIKCCRTEISGCSSRLVKPGGLSRCQGVWSSGLSNSRKLTKLRLRSAAAHVTRVPQAACTAHRVWSCEHSLWSESMMNPQMLSCRTPSGECAPPTATGTTPRSDGSDAGRRASRASTATPSGCSPVGSASSSPRTSCATSAPFDASSLLSPSPAIY